MKLELYPDPDCKFCHGTGEVYDWIGDGAFKVSMPSDCDCVTSQIPDTDEKIEIEILYDYD